MPPSSLFSCCVTFWSTFGGAFRLEVCFHWVCGGVCCLQATTPDKTVETFQYNFQFRAMVSSCLKETNSPPSPPLMQCCFGLAAQACISCVTANNIAIGEGGESLLICDSKHLCQGECKKIGILVMCLNRFCPRLSGGVFRHSLTVMSITASHCHIFRLHA